jgi:hypothetical protein
MSKSLVQKDVQLVADSSIFSGLDCALNLSCYGLLLLDERLVPYIYSHFRLETAHGA